MRGSHEDMVQILDAFEKEGNFFAQIELFVNSQRSIYQFGVTRSGYNTIKRIMQFRPFDPLSQSKYRYYWHYGCGPDKDFYLSIQFEQDNNVKVYPIKADKLLGSNLRWFLKNRNSSEIESLRVEI
jgi:hypothetical protein